MQVAKDTKVSPYRPMFKILHSTWKWENKVKENLNSQMKSRPQIIFSFLAW